MVVAISTIAIISAILAFIGSFLEFFEFKRGSFLRIRKREKANFTSGTAFGLLGFMGIMLAVAIWFSG